MLLALDLCCQGQEGLLPSAHAFVLGMQFPLRAHKVWGFFLLFLYLFAWSGKARTNPDTCKPEIPAFYLVSTESLLATAASLHAVVWF